MPVRRKYSSEAQPTIPDEYDFLYPKFTLENPSKQSKVENVLRPLVLGRYSVFKIKEVFINELELGLQENPKRQSSLQMENTFLPGLPNGSENGEFLALDLGGTNFRVIHVVINPSISSPEYHIKYHSVPESTRLGPGEHLFDFLASCIDDFLVEKELREKRLNLGFCFSFPMTQKALNKGILVSWTKSFNCTGVVGNDAVQMLKEALNRKGVTSVNVVAVVNDTTGTLVKGAYIDHNCYIGMILGTGSNACYMEKVANMPKFKDPAGQITEVVVDVEWGAFGDNGVLNFMKTEFDNAVDTNSLLVGSFTFEKMFAGKFLGELVRNVLVKLIREGLLFDGRASETLLTQQTFTTADVSAFETEDNIQQEAQVLERLGYSHPTEDDLKIIRYACGVASTRGALLVSICTATLLERMNRTSCTVAIDGSLFKYHPEFHKMMEEFLRFMAPDRKFKLMLAEDGSGKGAGLVAAVATRLIEEGVIRQ
ncbi:hexokinase-2-like [Varroa jacobsoni]|nr:hexokinase-2-like isoform X2 [Varroa destructor]XP_022656283.1 hexokinase-2-like isoform X2 [Varroa destructor]XP_022656284.1 hexokinase-2-like isoform X2 [Varroa destructor]XP_022704157.1 hexokinase-2-like [Varroa jacobsoni]